MTRTEMDIVAKIVSCYSIKTPAIQEMDNFVKKN